MADQKAPHTVGNETLPPLIASLLGGLNEVKINPQADTLAGIDRPSFELLISSLTGTNDIGHLEGITFIESQLKNIQKNTPVLENLNKAFASLQEYHGVVQESLSLLASKKASPETIEQRKGMWRFKSKAFTATVLSLPEELLKNTQSIDSLNRTYLGQRIINEDNLEQTSIEALVPLFTGVDRSEELTKESVLKIYRLSSSKDRQFQRILLANLRRLQKNSGINTMGEIPRSAFELIVKRVSGLKGIKLSNPQDIEKAITAIEGVSTNTRSYKGSLSLYEMLRRRALHTRLLLHTKGGEKFTPQQEAIALNYEPEQVFLASALTSLSDESLDDPLFHSTLESELKDYDISADKNIERSASEKIKSASEKRGKTITLEQQKTASLVVANNVSKVLPQGGGLSQVALAVAMSLAHLAPKDEPIEDMSAFEDEGGPSVFAPSLGLAFGIFTDVGKREEIETEEEYLKREERRDIDQKKKEQKPFDTGSPDEKPKHIDISSTDSTVPPSPSATNGGGFFGSFGRLFKNIASGAAIGASKIIKTGASFLNPVGWLGKIGFVLGRLFGRPSGIPSQGSSVDSVVKSSTYLTLGLLGALVIVLIVLPTFFANQKSSAFVTDIEGCNPGQGGPNPIAFGQNTCPITPYIIAQNLTPTPIPQISTTPSQPPPSETSSVLPQGFPITSSCVTQKPGGSFSHTYSNAVDLVVLGNTPNDWLIKSTHDGQVTFAGCINECTLGFGYVAFIKSSDNRFTTIYGHMQSNSLRVKTGDFVLKGQSIGIVNHTGFSTAKHLHYELRSGQGTQNYEAFGRVGTILNYLPPSSTWQCNL